MDVAEPPLRRLVKIHPETHRKSLSIGRHAFAIPGLTEDETEALLHRLRDHACREPRVWNHNWTVGDVIIWDNRRLMHRGHPWDMSQPRVMWHSRMAGSPASDSH
jgi:alpha-ketoglutarate-dependent taurine dioxygenase